MPVTEIPVAANDHKLNHHLADKVADNQSVGGENIYSVPFPDKMRNRYSYDARSFEQIQYNGKQLNIASSAAANLEEPLHAEITGNPHATSGFFRLVMPLAMARHAVTAIAESYNGYEGLKPWLDKVGFGDFTVGSIVDKIVPNSSDKVKLVTDFFQKAADENIGVGELNKHIDDYKKVKSVFLSSGKNYETEQLISDTYKSFLSEGEGKNFYDSKIKSIESALKKDQFGHIFDACLGAMVVGVTIKYSVDVYHDMYRCFAEAIAYEKYDERKKPSEVNFLDLASSDNKIIQETFQNYVAKNVFRFGMAGLFLGRFACEFLGQFEENFHLGSHFPFGNLALGALGGTMYTEVSRKDSSLFNDIVDLIDNKLDSQHAAEEITASDLYNLYQKYCIKNAPDKVFKDVTHSDYGDEGRWESARAIFQRMAEMMNHTYKYKDTNINKEDPVAQIEQEITSCLEYFTLIKFLHLLGHDKINFDNSELTLACAEIANTYSIQAAMQFWDRVTLEQIPLEDALKNYVVDLRQTLGRTNVEIDKISDSTPIYKNAILENFLIKNPDIHKKYDELIEIREAIKLEGKTPALINKSNIIIEDVKSLLNQRQSHIDGDHEVETKNNIGTPETSINNVVKFQRMADNLLSGQRRAF
jgi:hypothetical protein